MVAPAPLECSVTGCSYATPAGTPTWDNMITLMGQHTQGAHPAPAPAPQTPPQPTTRLEKLPRPTFTLNMTESQWKFTELQWNAYISQTEVQDATKLMQLQAACNIELRQRVFDTGTYPNLNTPALFLAKMKEFRLLDTTYHS